MWPSFAAAISNYTTTCPAGSVKVSTSTAAKATVRVNALAATTGSHSATVQLAPGQRFTVRITAAGVTHGYSVRCTPSDFPSFSASGRLPAAAPLIAFSEVRAFVFGGIVAPYAIVTDSRGVPIWWMRTGAQTPFNVTALPGSRIAFWKGVPFVGGVDDGNFEVHNADGSLATSVNFSGGPTDAHEALAAKGGGWYVASYRRRDHVDLSAIGGSADGSALDAVIQQLAADGHVVWTWDSLDHIALKETVLPIIWGGSGGSPAVEDLVHLNSIEEDAHGGLVVSFRDTNSVIRIRKSDGSVAWKLGGSRTSASLKVIGDGSPQPLAGQHDARLQPDGSLTVADNRTAVAKSPRVTRWRIDAIKHTATLVEQFTDSGLGISICCGSARRLADKSWIDDWGGNQHIRAYTASHKRIFDLTFANSGFAYRASPITPANGSLNAFVAGMDAMNPRR